MGYIRDETGTDEEANKSGKGGSMGRKKKKEAGVKENTRPKTEPRELGHALGAA